GSSVPCASKMQQMVEHDFEDMDILERDMPKLVHIYRRRVSNRIEKVPYAFKLFGDSDEEEIKAQRTSTN
nr:hypothetical protein [Tanacetum cinerariifolium]